MISLSCQKELFMTQSPKFRYCLGVAALVLSPLFCAAQKHKPVYREFTVPDSVATYPLSLNAGRTVTGYYVTKDSVTHGFVRDENGVITQFDVPGSASTRPDSINFAGEITGTYITGPTDPLPGTPQGFVRSVEGKITLFGSTINLGGSNRSFFANPAQINVDGEVVGNLPYPLAAPGVFVRSRSGVVQLFSLSFGASYPTVVTGLNAGGAVVGYTSSNNQNFQGFLWSGQGPVPSPVSGSLTSISVSGSMATFPTALNAEGAVVGCYSITNPAPPNAQTYYDFLYEPDGTITTLAVPGTIPYCGYVGDELTGVYNVVPRTITLNREGTIIGTYTNAAKVPVGFIRKKDGKLTTLAHPNATMTMPTAINNEDVIIGYFARGTDIKGFIRLPEGRDK
jgi:hypothetical protein